MKISIKISKCSDCPHHKVINDADPFDSFNMDDVAIVCLKKENPKIDTSSYYRSDASPNKVIAASLRPYEIKKVKIPNWCPLQS